MSRPLKVALLQLRAFDLAEHEAAWEEMLRRIDEAAATEPDLVVLPEGSYPASFLPSPEAYEAANVLPDAEVEAALGEHAVRHGCYIAAGLVLRGAGETPQRACVLFAPDGAVTGRHAAPYRWGIDEGRIAGEGGSPLLDVAGARAGLLLATGGLPEIARAAATDGAELIVIPGAWRSTDRDGASSADYLLRARAIETGAWVASAHKVGVEAGSLVYAGRSGVVDPRGEWVTQAPGDRAGTVTCTLDLDASAGPPVRRRPELYAQTGATGEGSRAAEQAREPLIVEDAAARVGAVALDAGPSAVEVMERARLLVHALAAQDAALAVLPDLAGTDARAVTEREFLPLFAELSEEARILVAVQVAEREGGRTFKTVYLMQGRRVLAAHRQTHLSEEALVAGFSAGDEPPPVVETAVGHVGVIGGSEGLTPELARSVRLRGAELLAWSAGAVPYPLAVLARTRAREHGVYVVAAGGAAPAGGGYVVDPTGALLGETPAGEQMAASAVVNRALARRGGVTAAPQPLRHRDPAAFATLFDAPERDADDQGGRR